MPSLISPSPAPTCQGTCSIGLKMFPETEDRKGRTLLIPKVGETSIEDVISRGFFLSIAALMPRIFWIHALPLDITTPHTSKPS